MPLTLIVFGVVVAFDGWTVKAALFSLEGPVHALYLTIRPVKDSPDPGWKGRDHLIPEDGPAGFVNKPWPSDR